jgi:XTP/dITP diphosphohydrolase
MNKKIIFATGNQGKMNEIREIYQDLDYELLSMKEAGIQVDIVEDGTTFEENAMIKAKAVAACCDAIVLADDSGLEVDYLNKEPGVYSARYLGEDTSYDVKNGAILQRMEGVPKPQRTARFVCAVAAVFPDGDTACVRGTIEGYIGYEPKGEHGFGYDPIFYIEELGCSSAELLPEEKNKISHRGKALQMMKKELEKHEDINRK